MALVITEPAQTVNGLLTKAIAAKSQILYIITNAISTGDGYHITVDIFDDDDGGAKITTTPLKYVANQAGELTIDLSGIISGVMSDPDATLFSLQFHLEIIEVSQAGSETPIITATLQAILAKEQLLHQGGALMWSRVSATDFPRAPRTTAPL